MAYSYDRTARAKTAKSPEQYGRDAYKKGIKAPALDKSFVKDVLQKGSGEIGASMPALQAWHKGWSDEHIKDSDRQLREEGFFDDE